MYHGERRYGISMMGIFKCLRGSKLHGYKTGPDGGYEEAFSYNYIYLKYLEYPLQYDIF